MSNTLAVDLGSTNLKAAIFDQHFNRLADLTTPVSYSLQEEGYYEIDPTWFIDASFELIASICKAARVKPSEVERLAVTSQAQTFLLLDEYYRPLTPLLSWLDTRAGPQAEYLTQILSPGFHQHCSFAVPLAELALSKLAWLKRFEPSLIKRTHLVAFLPSFFINRLGFPSCTEPNLASMSGLYSLAGHTWWENAIHQCGINNYQLPRLVETGASLQPQALTPSLQLSPDIRLHLCGNDQTCSALGAPVEGELLHENDIVLTLGTALVAYRFAGGRPGPYTAQTAWGPYPLGGFYELAAISEGTLLLDRASEKLLPGQPLTAFFILAEQAARSYSMRKNGSLGRQESTADVSPDETISPRTESKTNDGSLGLQALELLTKISQEFASLVESMNNHQTYQHLIAGGGGSRSDFWLEMLTDLFQQPVQRTAGDALLGAARLALLRKES
jgi:xylulokinase